jgi:crossover junction endodeoxyribonuclease RuvC
MRILGIDPALTITGYGAIDFSKNRISLLEAGVITTVSGDPLPERLIKIYDAVGSLIKDTRSEIMVLEKLYAHWRHPTTAFILGEARGVICLACERFRVDLVEYSATRVKKAIVGRGLASKEQVQRMVIHTLGLKKPPKYSDVTDALALAITHGRVMHVNL